MEQRICPPQMAGDLPTPCLSLVRREVCRGSFAQCAPQDKSCRSASSTEGAIPYRLYVTPKSMYCGECPAVARAFVAPGRGSEALSGSTTPVVRLWITLWINDAVWAIRRSLATHPLLAKVWSSPDWHGPLLCFT